MKMPKTLLPWVGSLLTGLITLPVSAQNVVEGSFERILTVSEGASVDVRTGVGLITIRQGDPGRIEVHGMVRVRERDLSRSEAEDLVNRIEANPPIEQAANTVSVGYRDSRDRDLQRYASISYEIELPPGTRVQARTGSGGIQAESLRGEIVASTGSGSISVSRAASDNMELSTGSGEVSVTGAIRVLQIRTGSGGIMVEGQQSGRWDLKTGSGTINVRLPNEAGFELDAHTGSGSVSTNRPITIRGRIDGRARNISGTVGAGGPALVLRTGSGGIDIE
jgi:hypothetical protein